MKQKLLLLMMLVGIGLSAYAQNIPYNKQENFLKANSVWVFNGRGLNFNTGNPHVFEMPSALRFPGSSGTASVADPQTGDLLFYYDGGFFTAGGECRNKNGDVMPNGDSLLGNSNLSTTTFSTDQGNCIVPVIDSPGKYYLFSLLGLTGGVANYSLGSLFYSIVDMSRAGGLGDIDTNQKNVVVSYEVFAEGMIAIPGDNCDIWLLLHKYNAGTFMAYHITSSGIDTVPVESNVGTPPPNAYTKGVMAVSSNRQKIAIGNSGTYPLIAAFNPTTGEVSNPIHIDLQNDFGGEGFGCIFSPDNSKLYIFDDSINQFDVSVYDSASILSSRISMPRPTTTFNGYSRLYNDTIYFQTAVTHIVDRICKPNLVGPSCVYQDSAIQLIPNTPEYCLGTITEVVFPLPPDTAFSISMDTVICAGGQVLLEPEADYGNYLWSDGTTTLTNQVNAEGVYWLIQGDGCHSYIDSFFVRYAELPEPVIDVNVLELGISGNFSYSGYQWLLNDAVIPGATQRTYDVLENGDYRVVVYNELGCSDTSDVYTVTNAGPNSLSDLDRVSREIRVYPNPTSALIQVRAPVAISVDLYGIEGKLLKRINNAHEIDFAEFANGLYFLEIYNLKGDLLKIEKLVKQ